MIALDTLCMANYPNFRRHEGKTNKRDVDWCLENGCPVRLFLIGGPRCY